MTYCERFIVIDRSGSEKNCDEIEFVSTEIAIDFDK